jgi:hypothetical protein
MWSRFSTLSNGNPWQQPDPSSSSSSSNDANLRQNKTTTPAYTPYQPRSKPSHSSASSSSSASPNYSEPTTRPSRAPHHPVRQPSSALSINPWETISKEEASPPPRPDPLLPSPLPTNPIRGSLDIRQEESTSSASGGGGAGDPLGVGGL